MFPPAVLQRGCSGVLLCFQRLYLRPSKERCGIGFAVALAAVDKYHLKQGLCAVQDFKPGGFPACPGFHPLRDACVLLGLCNALGVDRRGLCTVPCSVQALGKRPGVLSEQLPCLVHDLGTIVTLHGFASLYNQGQGCYNCLARFGFGSAVGLATGAGPFLLRFGFPRPLAGFRFVTGEPSSGGLYSCL